jgi:hypothetical protein
MKSFAVIAPALLGVAVSSPVVAQCVPVARVAQLRADAVRVLAGPDNRERLIADLPKVEASRIRVVTDSARCHRAGQWYIRDQEGSDPKITTSDPFAVVQADSLLWVEPDIYAGHRGCCWVVRVYDLAGKNQYNYGKGQ